MKRIGVLTSGGDAPGMNAAIRAAVRTAMKNSIEWGGHPPGGWGGPDRRGYPSHECPGSVSRIINRGAGPSTTAAATSSATPEGQKKRPPTPASCWGWTASWPSAATAPSGWAQDLSRFGVSVVGVPGTIDNDIVCTDDAIGSRYRRQYRRGAHRPSAGHHGVPRTLLRGGGHGPSRRAIRPCSVRRSRGGHRCAGTGASV